MPAAAPVTAVSRGCGAAGQPPPGGSCLTVAMLGPGADRALVGVGVSLGPPPPPGAPLNSTTETTTAWAATGRGGVSGTPALVTSPTNASTARLLYLGYDDGTLRAVDASSGALAWATGPAALGLGNPSPSSIVADWGADLVAVQDWYGDVAMLSLASGATLAVLGVGDLLSSWLGMGTPYPVMVCVGGGEPPH